MEVRPSQLKQFFANLQTPLTSLYICGPHWMTDAHVVAIMPIVGENLMRLELVRCLAWEEEGPDRLLSDFSAVSIAHHCKQLKSFAMVESDVTCHGLEMVVSANTGITTLNLSSNNKRLYTPDDRAIGIISRHLPRLEVLRNYWPDPRTPDWLNDSSLIALVDAQERESGGSGIFLKLLGWYSLAPQLTIRGIKYAIEKGVKEIEIDRPGFYSIKDLGSDVKFYHPEYSHYIDASYYERTGVLTSRHL